jgi:hypothetical protein
MIRLGKKNLFLVVNGNESIISESRSQIALFIRFVWILISVRIDIRHKFKQKLFGWKSTFEQNFNVDLLKNK